MSFDPYAVWLDIPPHHQPPQPWRLLAVTPDCSDPQLLRQAAERAETRVRQAAGPDQQELAEQVCRQIRAAVTQLSGSGSGNVAPGEQPLAPPGQSPDRAREQTLAPPPSPQLEPVRRVNARPVETPLGAPAPPSSTANQAPTIPAPGPPGRPNEIPQQTSQPARQESPLTAPGGERPVRTPAQPTGPLPLGPPQQSTPASDTTSNSAPNSTQTSVFSSEPSQASPPDGDSFVPFPEDDSGPGPVLIAAISISCFLLGVVLMLIFILLR